jgi:hypothetical protein
MHLFAGASFSGTSQQMAIADWQTKLDGLQGLNDDEKNAAESMFIQRNLSMDERNGLLRGTDRQAADRIKRLLSKSCWSGPTISEEL